MPDLTIILVEDDDGHATRFAVHLSTATDDPRKKNVSA